MTDLHRVRTVFTGVAGTPWYSNQYYALAGASSGAVRAATADFWTDIANAYSADVDWTVEGPTSVINDTTGQLLRVDPGADLSGSGANAGNELPWMTQCLVNLRTDNYTAGRMIQGKMFLPGFVTGNVVDGVFDTVALSVIQNALDTWLAAVDGLLVVWSKTHGTHGFVTNAVAQAKPSVLRSRRD